jgi:hypothetical protein
MTVGPRKNRHFSTAAMVAGTSCSVTSRSTLGRLESAHPDCQRCRRGLIFDALAGGNPVARQDRCTVSEYLFDVDGLTMEISN